MELDDLWFWFSVELNGSGFGFQRDWTVLVFSGIGRWSSWTGLGFQWIGRWSSWTWDSVDLDTGVREHHLGFQWIWTVAFMDPDFKGDGLRFFIEFGPGLSGLGLRT